MVVLGLKALPHQAPRRPSHTATDRRDSREAEGGGRVSFEIETGLGFVSRRPHLGNDRIGTIRFSESIRASVKQCSKATNGLQRELNKLKKQVEVTVTECQSS